MKFNPSIVFWIVPFLALLSFSCTPLATETTESLTPPSPEELAQNNFTLPEIPRILCEQLKQMMDRGDSYTLIDTRLSETFKLGYLPGAVNIPEDDSSPPFTQEWVNDQLKVLPKNKITVFYCD